MSKVCASLTLLLSLVVWVDSAFTAPRPCRFGLKGLYVDWSKTGSRSGRGTFSPLSGEAAVLPNFSWEVSGKPLSVKIGTDEPFGGGNSMKGFYGQADDATNLNVRIEANEARPGQLIPHQSIVTLTFDAGTPASGWAFAVLDIDVDQVRFRAKDTTGAPLPPRVIAGWFQQRFDASPSVDGVNIPFWDPNEPGVIGSESGSTSWRTTVKGNLRDTESASAWFQPNTSLSELSFEYASLQDDATPSFHILLAACASRQVAPTPTPAPTGDSDGDGITDSIEGTGDPDNDFNPNYTDEDSDGDTIPDSVEGDEDTDNDEIPDYLDEDSDGDDVPDRIERDPDGTAPTPRDSDDDRNGIDDGEEGDTLEPLTDTDSDGTVDAEDSDSDNDGTPDGTEAYDLDGDGERDVGPSGNDDDNDGLDDAFEKFDSPTDLNPIFAGVSSPPPCRDLNLQGTKQAIRKRLNALAARVPRFSARAKACQSASVAGLIDRAATTRRAFERTLANTFADEELRCPGSVCPMEKTSTVKNDLAKLAIQLGATAKAAKLAAITACGEGAEDPNAPRRPGTPTFVAQLLKEVRQLPNTVSRCGG